VVLAVFGFAEFVDEELDCFGGGAEEADAFQVAHALPRRVLQPTTKRCQPFTHT
jgi:hypothetical protein